MQPVHFVLCVLSGWHKKLIDIAMQAGDYLRFGSSKDYSMKYIGRRCLRFAVIPDPQGELIPSME